MTTAVMAWKPSFTSPNDLLERARGPIRAASSARVATGTGRFWQLSTGMHVPDRLKLAEHSYDADHDQAECDFNSGKDTKEAHGLIPAAAGQPWCEPKSIYASEP